MARFQSKLPHTVLEAKHWSRSLGPQQKRIIVLHSMECNEKGDTAEWCARYFSGTLNPGKDGKRPEAPRASAHFCIDDNSIVQCVPAEMIAWHAPGANTHGIGLEHAGWHRQTRAEWLDDYGCRMLPRSARLCAELCRHFEIPVQFLDEAELRKDGATGITTHEKVTLAWPEKGSHRDPGTGFPLTAYLDWVRSYTSGEL